MIILGIETSCDETSVSIVKNGTEILSHALATSLELQREYGGVVPEVASRKQVEYMIPVLQKAFHDSKLEFEDIDAIAVTVGPGLMGSLLVGVETAKTLSYVWNKPLIPVNHMVGHVYSAWLDETKTNEPQFPLLALIASGGHTDLVIMHNHHLFEKIGSTLDDAVGEAYDKVARLLNLPYPGGPEIERIAKDGDENAFTFPKPMIDKPNYNFSYSGLKTSVLYTIRDLPPINDETRNNVAASFQKSALEPLVHKTIKAALEFEVKTILVTGGVAANNRLRDIMTKATAEQTNCDLFIPPLTLATDNATYIAAAAYYAPKSDHIHPQENKQLLLNLEPDVSLRIDS